MERAKKKINVKTAKLSLFPKEGEVWILVLGKNIGIEQDGSGASFLRPVLVVKRFNNQMFWIIPLSTKQKQLDFYFNFTDPYGKQISAILAQLRFVSINRFKRPLYTLSKDLYTNIREILFHV